MYATTQERAYSICYVLFLPLFVYMFHYITKVIQNNTDMYTTDSSEQPFKIPNNNLHVTFQLKRLTKTTIMNTTDQKGNKKSHNLLRIKFQSIMILMHRTRFPQF